MASHETRILDHILAGRRALLVGGGAAVAALAMPAAVKAANKITTYTDNDILNFALNLEYLEANFYYLAAFGTNIAQTSSLYPSGAMVQAVTGTGAQGSVVVKANSKVPFTNPAIAAYAVETAVEEGKHVNFLRDVLGSAAVAQPQLDLMGSFHTLSAAAGIGPAFDPFANDANFLIGAYIFEDVGVSAYHGAAPLISTSVAGKTILAAALGIHAVEAYHAGLVRTSILTVDNGVVFPTIPAGTLQGYTQQISAYRSELAQQIPRVPANPNDPTPDDYGVSATVAATLGSASVMRTSIVNADPVNAMGFARSTAQVLNIVTGGGAVTAGAKATGAFFPNGLNGLFS